MYLTALTLGARAAGGAHSVGQVAIASEFRPRCVSCHVRVDTIRNVGHIVEQGEQRPGAQAFTFTARAYGFIGFLLWSLAVTAV